MHTNVYIWACLDKAVMYGYINIQGFKKRYKGTS